MTDDSNSSAYDMDGSGFNNDAYVNKVLKECSLKDVMNVETVIIRDTQALHSDMQTLVYENYNKFISATDTMRKMKTEFKQMETEMNLLVSNVKSITEFSDQISSKLHDSRQQLSALSEKQALLQKLQFLSSLPTKLKNLIDEGNYSQAVKNYTQAQAVLEQYGYQPSFQGIKEDCQLIMEDLKVKLKADVQLAGFIAQALTDTSDLLLQLGEKPTTLSREILQIASKRLHEQIVILQDQTDGNMIEFIDMSINGFVNDLILIVDSYTDIFLKNSHATDYGTQFDELNSFVTSNLEKYSKLVQVRVEVEAGQGDYDVLLRAMDRLYRKLLTMKNLCSDIDMTTITLEIIVNAAEKLCNFHIKNIKDSFSDSLSSVRLSLVTGKGDVGSSAAATATRSSSDLMELVNRLYVTTNEKIKVVLNDLLIFIKPDWSFNIKSIPKGVACIEGIRENVVVGFLDYISTTMISYGDVNLACPPNLLLVFSKVCLEMEQIGVKKILQLVDDLYGIDPVANQSLTHENDLYMKMRNSAQTLLNSYVRLQSLNISQMLRKSVETRDWVNCLEPRSVRAVMKRVSDELTQIDNVLTDLYESGIQTAASSDSSRKTYLSLSASKQQHRSNWSSPSSHLEPMFGMHRLFSDKIDVFGPVQFTKISITTGIIKLSLKTLVECVRLRTFSTFGLQQIQVDMHYLQMHLERFVSDENVMQYLLEEVLNSAVHRCLEPKLMDPTAVGIICERS